MKTLILHHVKNPDVDHGYWPGYAPSCPKSQTVAVDSLEDASQKLTAWIDTHELGSGNLARDCGHVFEDGKQIARISYNGRAWKPGVWPTAEIKLNREVLA